jgi:predicted ABC-type transport system involved in lysophospholipase L1 biosynthesis ATPase subunit
LQVRCRIKLRVGIHTTLYYAPQALTGGRQRFVYICSALGEMPAFMAVFHGDNQKMRRYRSERYHRLS